MPTMLINVPVAVVPSEDGAVRDPVRLVTENVNGLADTLERVADIATEANVSVEITSSSTSEVMV